MKARRYGQEDQSGLLEMEARELDKTAAAAAAVACEEETGNNWAYLGWKFLHFSLPFFLTKKRRVQDSTFIHPVSLRSEGRPGGDDCEKTFPNRAGNEPKQRKGGRRAASSTQGIGNLAKWEENRTTNAMNYQGNESSVSYIPKLMDLTCTESLRYWVWSSHLTREEDRIETLRGVSIPNRNPGSPRFGASLYS